MSEQEQIIDPQPDPKKTAGRPIWELVIEDMRARDQFGRQKYSTPLQAHNGRDAAVDAYQEALDLCVYQRQQIAERADYLSRIAELERERDAAYETLEAIAVKGLCLSAVNGAEMPPDWARYRTMSEHVAALRRERDALAAALEEAKEMFRFIEGHPRYDWNADPEYLTLRIGEIYQSPSQAILDAHDAALTERVQRETLEQCEIMCCGTCGGTGHEERGWQGNVECSACDGSGAVVALRTIKREFSKEGK